MFQFFPFSPSKREEKRTARGIITLPFLKRKRARVNFPQSADCGVKKQAKEFSKCRNNKKKSYRYTRSGFYSTQFKWFLYICIFIFLNIQFFLRTWTTTENILEVNLLQFSANCENFTNTWDTSNPFWVCSNLLRICFYPPKGKGLEASIWGFVKLQISVLSICLLAFAGILFPFFSWFM